jgi:hypothetical protein
LEGTLAYLSPEQKNKPGAWIVPWIIALIYTH